MGLNIFPASSGGAVWGDITGTLSDQTDLQSALDAKANVSTTKVYRALLTQTGTDAPVATVLENSLGGTLVWTRSGTGVYLGTLAAAFPTAKTFLNFNNFSWDGVSSNTFGQFGDNNSVQLAIAAGDDFLSLAGGAPGMVEILVYP